MTRIHGRAPYAAAHAGRSAIVAFNVSNLETTQGVLAAAEAARSTVILQVSPGAIAYAGYRPLVRLVFDLADHSAAEVIVHLDHCRDPDVVAQAIRDGFGSVMFDGSLLPLDENVATTAQLVGLARSTDEGIAVEAELGRIGGREDTDPAAAWASRTSPEEAAAFVRSTDIDVLAPNLGNLHRMPHDSTRLDLDHLAAVSAAAERPLALHGASGIERSQLPGAIAAGVGKINLSSRVTRALADGIRSIWADDAEQLDLRRYLGAGREQVRSMAADYLALVAAAAPVKAMSRPGADPARTGADPGWTAVDEEPE